MSRITLTCFALLLLLFLGNSSENYAAQSKQNTSDAPTGTFQKMIVENGSVTMQSRSQPVQRNQLRPGKTHHSAFRRRSEFLFLRSGFQRPVARP